MSLGGVVIVPYLNRKRTDFLNPGRQFEAGRDYQQRLAQMEERELWEFEAPGS